VLLPGTASADASQRQVVGSVATVTIDITPEHVGEIVYTLGAIAAQRRARSVEALPSHADGGVIIRYEKGIAYVQDVEPVPASAGHRG